MPIDIKEVKEFEEKYKKILFEQIDKLCSKQTELLMGIDKMKEYIDLEKDLPNIGITLNNKIIELQHQFENAGISIYSQKAEDYGLAKQNFLMPSFIGQAVIYDLMEYTSSGINKLDSYSEKMDLLTKERNKRVQSLMPTTPFKRFFAKIKSFFKPIKQEDFEYTKEETDEVNSHLLEFRDIDNQLWNYNLRENIISSIVKHIRKQEYSAGVVPGLLEENINPDLQKLGLGNLIPELQHALIEEYKKDLPDAERYQITEDEMSLYVPNFDRIKGNEGEIDFEEIKAIREKYNALSKDDEELEL